MNIELQEELLRLQTNLKAAEQRMILGEPNVTLADTRAKLQKKYDNIYRPDGLYPIDTQKTYQN